MLTNTHVFESERTNTSQHDVTRIDDSASYVTHPSHIQYDNLPPQQHVYERVN